MANSARNDSVGLNRELPADPYVKALGVNPAFEEVFAMTKLLMLAAAAALMLSGPASAQEPKQMTNCSERTGTSGRAGQNAQAVEKSAILPSAGGGQSSAAPTVQRDGKSVEVRSDCPEENKK
jgi:hypothetical protein